MNLFNLNGKRALITGGTHGLGMAMAEGLAQAGADALVAGSFVFGASDPVATIAALKSL